MTSPTPLRSTPLRTEQIILFRSSTQIFAISSGSVQEVRSVDSLAGSAAELGDSSVKKVRHVLRRTDRTLYVVNSALHFGLRAALLVDGIEKMTTMTRLQALPPAFCNEERLWYRGLTVLDQNVIPVVNPLGFLTNEELLQLDAIANPVAAGTSPAVNEAGLSL
jgi:chemotaxis signal transduction protein